MDTYGSHYCGLPVKHWNRRKGREKLVEDRKRATGKAALCVRFDLTHCQIVRWDKCLLLLIHLSRISREPQQLLIVQWDGLVSSRRPCIWTVTLMGHVSIRTRTTGFTNSLYPEATSKLSGDLKRHHWELPRTTNTSCHTAPYGHSSYCWAAHTSYLMQSCTLSACTRTLGPLAQTGCFPCTVVHFSAF